MERSPKCPDARPTTRGADLCNEPVRDFSRERMFSAMLAGALFLLSMVPAAAQESPKAETKVLHLCLGNTDRGLKVFATSLDCAVREYKVTPVFRSTNEAMFSMNGKVIGSAAFVDRVDVGESPSGDYGKDVERRYSLHLAHAMPRDDRRTCSVERLRDGFPGGKGENVYGLPHNGSSDDDVVLASITVPDSYWKMPEAFQDNITYLVSCRDAEP